MTGFTAAITAAWEASGLSTGKAAEMIGVGKSTFGSWIRTGALPDRMFLPALVEAFGLDGHAMMQLYSDALVGKGNAPRGGLRCGDCLHWFAEARRDEVDMHLYGHCGRLDARTERCDKCRAVRG